MDTFGILSNHIFSRRSRDLATSLMSITKEGPAVHGGGSDKSGGSAGMGYFSGDGFSEEASDYGHAGDGFELMKRDGCGAANDLVWDRLEVRARMSKW